MRPLRSLASVAAALAVAVAGSGCGLIGGSDPTAEALAQAPPVEVDLAPALLAALERDLGLSEDQAYQRIQFETWAGQTVAALQAELGDERYGGSWLTDDQRLMVAVTDQDAADLVREAGAEPVVVGRAAGYLRAVMAFLDEHADQIAAVVESLAGWHVDVTGNRVVVTAPPWAEPIAERFRAEAGPLNDVIEIVISDEQPRLLQEIRGGDEYLITSGGPNLGRCSVGFPVVRQDGGAGYVTAGHCALAGGSTVDPDGSPQGEFLAASFPGVGQSGPRDWAVVAVYDGWSLRPEVSDYQGGVLPVAGSVEAPVGSTVCRYGATTGVACGVILSKNSTVIYPEGTIRGMTRTDACAEPGDSGGAWLAGDQAQGVTSGGSGDCTEGGFTYFQPLNEILTQNQLTLLTTNGAGQPERQAAPDGCEGYDHTFRGQVSAPPGVGVEPGGRYYRALSDGTHSLCLAGPAAAKFDLVLQRWDGEAWQPAAWTDGPTSAEQLSFEGSAGYYRIGVVATDNAAGPYVVGLTFTRS